MVSKPVNDTWYNRYSVLTLIALLKRVRPHHGCVLILTADICVKYGSRVDLSEASAMRFVSQRTPVPVPKVYCAFTHGERTYIVMQRIHGTMLAQGWVRRSDESKARLLSQLAQMVREWRAIPPEGPGVHNVDGDSLFDLRLPGPLLRFGPFENVHAFHRYLRQDFRPNPNLPPEVNELIELQDGPWSPPVFTHGDLSSLNIMARGDDIVGIVDWETAGWLPSYWEYTTACQVNPQNSFWREEIEKFLEPIPKALAMEQIRQRYFGDF